VCSTNTKPLHEDRVCAPHAADGSASGEAQIENRSSGFLGHAEIDCLNVLGNVAVMSGVYTFASNPDLVGSDVLFAVRDNGEGPSAPTRSRSPSRASGSRARTSPTPLSWHCSSHPSRVDRSKSGPEQASAVASGAQKRAFQPQLVAVVGLVPNSRSASSELDSNSAAAPVLTARPYVVHARRRPSGWGRRRP